MSNKLRTNLIDLVQSLRKAAALKIKEIINSKKDLIAVPFCKINLRKIKV
jgi:hypothetical protein